MGNEHSGLRLDSGKCHFWQDGPGAQVVLPITSVTRVEDVIQKDVGLNFLRIFGSQDLTGARGKQRIRGIQGV